MSVFTPHLTMKEDGSEFLILCTVDWWRLLTSTTQLTETLMEVTYGWRLNGRVELLHSTLDLILNRVKGGWVYVEKSYLVASIKHSRSTRKRIHKKRRNISSICKLNSKPSKCRGMVERKCRNTSNHRNRANKLNAIIK